MEWARTSPELRPAACSTPASLVCEPASAWPSTATTAAMAADAASSAGLPGRTGLETPSLSESQAQAGKPLLVALPMTAYVNCRWLPCMKPPPPWSWEPGAGSREPGTPRNSPCPATQVPAVERRISSTTGVNTIESFFDAWMRHMNTTPVSGLQMSRDGFAFVDSTRRPVRSELRSSAPPCRCAGFPLPEATHAYL